MKNSPKYPLILFIIFLFSIVVVFVWRSNQLEHAFMQNLGLVYINKGLVKGNEYDTKTGQIFLSSINNQRYQSFYEDESDEDNLLVNGSFEFKGYGWVIGGKSQITQDIAFSGQRSLVIDFSESVSNFYHTYQRVGVEPEGCYQLNAQIRTAGITGGVHLEAWDSDRGHKYWYSGKTPSVDNTSEWTNVSLEFCIPSDVDKIQIRIRAKQQSDASGLAWVDTVELKKISP